jgi:hypothetical protein
VPAAKAPRSWLMDTGSGNDLISETQVPKRAEREELDESISLNTANGLITVDEQAIMQSIALGDVVEPLILPSTPAVLSIGKRCMNLGYSFVWKAGHKPVLITPGKKVIKLDVENDVPFLREKGRTVNSTPAPVATAVPCCVALLMPNLGVKPEINLGIKPEIKVPDKKHSALVCANSADESTDYELLPELEDETSDAESVESDDIGSLLSDNNDNYDTASVFEFLDGAAIPAAPGSNPGQEDSEEWSDLDDSDLGLEDEETGWNSGEDSNKVEDSKDHCDHRTFIEGCNSCQEARPRRTRRTRKPSGYSRGVALKFGDSCSCDHIINKIDESDWGIEGERCALVFSDTFTGWLEIVPAQSKSTEAVIEAIVLFKGPDDLARLRHDGAREYKAACRQLRINDTTSTPEQPNSNSRAELGVKEAKLGARTQVIQSTLEHEFWPHASRYHSFVRNTSIHKGDSAYNLR